MVRLRWFLTMTTILAATVVLTVLISTGFDQGGDSRDQVMAAPPSTTSTTTGASVRGVATGATQVSGTVTAVHLEGAVLEPRQVATPFTITSERGFGNGGQIAGVLVDGAPATIEWDAGRPFVLSSGGALVLDPVRVDLTAEGLRLNLAAVHMLLPGTYHLDTPVAVGTSGVAGARESVVFEAIEGSTFEGRGDASIVLSGEPRRLRGPGVVHLEGTLELTEPAGKRAVTRLDTADGAFDLTLTPTADGAWTVGGVLGGELTAT